MRCLERGRNVSRRSRTKGSIDDSKWRERTQSQIRLLHIGEAYIRGTRMFFGSIQSRHIGMMWNVIPAFRDFAFLLLLVLQESRCILHFKLGWIFGRIMEGRIERDNSNQGEGRELRRATTTTRNILLMARERNGMISRLGTGFLQWRDGLCKKY